MYEPWTCAKCGATNTTDRSTCIACNTPRPVPLPAASAPPPLPAARLGARGEAQKIPPSQPTVSVPPPAPAVGAPPPLPPQAVPPSLRNLDVPAFAQPGAPVATAPSGPRSVLKKALVTGRWITAATPGQAGSIAQALLASARMQVETRPALNGLEISATRVPPPGSKGLHLAMRGPDVPMHASVRLVSVPGGTAVEAAFEETWARFNPKASSIYVLQQNDFDGYFRQLLMGLFQAFPAVPGSTFSIEPALPLAQTPIGICQRCGAVAPTQDVQFQQHIGAIILMFRKSLKAYLCKRCIREVYKKYTLTTLFLGWWGVISLFFTPVVLILNVTTYNSTRQLGEPLSGPGGVGAALPEPARKPRWKIPFWIGVALGVIAILLALIVSLGQSSSTSGTSLVGELMVCPAPLFVVGLGLGLWGFLWRRRALSQAGKAD